MGSRWTEYEDSVIQCWLTGRITFPKACELIPDRTPTAIRKKCDLASVLSTIEDKNTPDRLAREEQDSAFCNALRRAIDLGLETATIGVVTTPDDAEFRPVTFRPELHGSGCSSAAALCAENAPGNGFA